MSRDRMFLFWVSAALLLAQVESAVVLARLSHNRIPFRQDRAVNIGLERDLWLDEIMYHKRHIGLKRVGSAAARYLRCLAA